MKNIWKYGCYCLCALWGLITGLLDVRVNDILFWVGLIFIALSFAFGFLAGKKEQNRIKERIVLGRSGSGMVRMHLKPVIADKKEEEQFAGDQEKEVEKDYVSM